MIEKNEGDSKPIIAQTNDYNRKLDDVRKQLIKRTNEEQKKVKVQRQLLKTIEEVEQWHAVTANQLAAYGTVKDSPEKIKEQLENVNVSLYLLSVSF